MKTPNLRSTIVVLSTLALFPACAKKKEDPKPAPQPIVQPQLITDRNYVSACDTVGPNLSYIHVLYANNERVLLTTEAYKSDRCAPNTMSYKVESTLAYKLGAVRAEKVLEIDSREESLVMYPVTLEQANLWNGIRYCNKTDWNTSQQPTISRVSSGCVDAVNKELPPFSLAKIEADRITLAVSANRDEDGTTAPRRYSNIANPLVYVRGGTVGVINPNPVGACPNLAGVYACTNSNDSTFAGKNAGVSNTTNAAGRPVVRFDLTQAGQLSKQIDMIPGDADRITSVGSSHQLISREFCEQGLLKSTETLSRVNDLPNRTVTDRSFGLDTSGAAVKLVVNTNETEFVNDRQGRTQGTRTECVKIQ